MDGHTLVVHSIMKYYHKMKISFVLVLKHGLLYEKRFVGFIHLCVSCNGNENMPERYVIPATRLNTCMQACT